MLMNSSGNHLMKIEFEYIWISEQLIDFKIQIKQAF